jgi:hypothetical protein
MAGLVPAIHEKKDVDPRDKPGDDALGCFEDLASEKHPCPTKAVM